MCLLFIIYFQIKLHFHSIIIKHKLDYIISSTLNEIRIWELMSVSNHFYQFITTFWATGQIWKYPSALEFWRTSEQYFNGFG